MKTMILSFFAIFAIANLTFSQTFDHFPGELLVQMKEGYDVERMVQRLANINGRATGLRAIREVSPPFRIWLLEFDETGFDEQEMLSLMRRQHDVAIAQFNHVISLRDTIPDDPFFQTQWQWRNTGQSGGNPDADVDADEAWSFTTGGHTASGDEIVVCVLEGTDRNHPDLQGNLWFNHAEIPDNGIDDDANGYVDDYEGWNVATNTDDINPEGHGTTVAGMIGAVGNNATLVSGLNWNVKIMNVDFNNDVSEDNALASYTYPYVMRKLYNETNGSKGALVVATNASWGIDFGQPADAPLWCMFYDSLGSVGILSCGATANNNVNIDQVGDLPTACPSEFLISVTATNSSDVRTFSGYGTEHIDVGAPGEDIVSIGLNNSPVTSSGTSFASPLVAGLIGLMYSAPCPYLGNLAKSDPPQAATLVRDAIFYSVDTVPALLNEVKYGGRVNARKAIERLLENCGPCPAPFGLTVSELLDTSAYISWVPYDSALSTQLRYRLVGDSVWTVFFDAQSPFFLNNLKPCSAYEIELISICADTLGAATTLTFLTDGCCKPPKGLAYDNLTDSTVNITWNGVLAAESYNVLLIANGDTTAINGIQQTGLYLTGLLPCTDYLLQVQTVCDTSSTPPALAELAFSTYGCGACTDLNYCPSASDNATEEWIANVTLGSLNNTSTSAGGYSDFTGISTTLNTYGTYTMYVTPDYAAGTYPEWIKAWIDFNQDGDFSAAEEIFSSDGFVTNTVSDVVLIPPDALTGITRMRVSMRWNAPPEPCLEFFNYGEVEDYCIEIVEGTPPDCEPPSNIETISIEHTSAVVQWTEAPNSLQYVLEFRPAGSSNWVDVPLTGTSVTLDSLDACTLYEFRLKSQCPFLESDWSVVDSFSTLCYPPCDVVPAGLDTSNVGSNTATLSWDATSNAISYTVSYQEAGDSTATFLNTIVNSVVVGNLDSCTTYLFSVAALCLGNNLSDFSEPFVFTTQCASTTTERIPGVAAAVSPNPFDDFLRINLLLETELFLQVQLLTTDGRVIRQYGRSWPAGASEWQLEGLADVPAGVYLLRLSTGSGMLGIRVVKY